MGVHRITLKKNKIKDSSFFCSITKNSYTSHFSSCVMKNLFKTFFKPTYQNTSKDVNQIGEEIREKFGQKFGLDCDLSSGFW